jgi:hypothetical protein
MDRLASRFESRVQVPARSPAANQNMRPADSVGSPAFPGDAVARIFRPGRSVMNAIGSRRRVWKLVFEPRSPSFIEPLMGWTGTRDMLRQVELSFPTLEAAIGYAERNGLAYVVQPDVEANGRRWRTAARRAAAAQTALRVVELRQWRRKLQTGFDLERALLAPAEMFDSPQAVAKDRRLTLEQKRAILRNWAWDEYLLEVATGEGMPEGARPSRLREVELALLELEKNGADDRQAANENSRLPAGVPARAA